jgi:hypothetical protein
MNSTCPGISSPLLRYRDENVRRARRSVLHSFPGRNPDESAEKQQVFNKFLVVVSLIIS